MGSRTLKTVELWLKITWKATTVCWLFSPFTSLVPKKWTSQQIEESLLKHWLKLQSLNQFVNKNEYDWSVMDIWRVVLFSDAQQMQHQESPTASQPIFFFKWLFPWTNSSGHICQWWQMSHKWMLVTLQQTQMTRITGLEMSVIPI